MRTKRWMATCVVALLSVAAVLAKDIRVVVFKVSQMHLSLIHISEPTRP